MKKIYLSIVALVATIMPSMAQTELWNNADQSLDSYYIAPNWATDANSSASYDPSTGVATVHIDKGLAGQWQGQVKLTTKGINYDPAKYYVFSCTFNSNNAAKNSTVKLDDVAGIVYDNKVNVAVGETNYTSKAAKGAAGGKNILVFDFGYAPANTDLTISNISIKEYDENPDNANPADEVKPLNYNDPANRWKAVDEGEAFEEVTCWFANSSWNQIADPQWNQNGSEWSLVLTEGMGNLQWQGQFAIATTLDVWGGDEYDFCCIIESPKDLPGVTIKLTQNGDDNNYFFADRHDVQANKKYIYVEKGVSLGNDAEKIKLFFDFGGSPAGTQVTISNIVLINKSDASGIKTVSTTNNDAIYNLQGQRVSEPQKGINIIGGKKYMVK